MIFRRTGFLNFAALNNLKNPWEDTMKLFIGAVALAAFSAPTFGQTPEEFYKGRTVEIVVGTAPGGGC